MDAMDVTPSSDSRTLACTLPPQLLALVLARVEQAERLGTMARVCSAWRTAAVMATNSISACRPVGGGPIPPGITQDQATALSGWLQAHAAAAALDSLAVRSDNWYDPPTLQLPVQQLASLRSLDLGCMKVAVQGGADAQTATAPADLPLELSGITRLRLSISAVGLSTLPAFTNLRHLALSHPQAPSSSLELSGLLQLTHLHLCDDYAHGAVLASLAGLPCLQELELEVLGLFVEARRLAALPASLTKLYVSAEITLAPDSTPAVAQLTALRWLEVSRSTGFSLAVVRSMSSLQHLVVECTPLTTATTAPWEVDLAALSGLTNLQHLQLPVDDATSALVDTDADDVAALTASSQLTYLIIDGLVEQQRYGKMFPEGRQLPQLRDLIATMGLLGSTKNAEALVRCCPNLGRLEVSAAMQGEPVLDCFQRGELTWCSVAVLSSLQSLTRLSITVTVNPGDDLQDSPECNAVFWRSMATVTSLRDLYINNLDMEHFGGIVELTSCQRLTHLLTDRYTNYYHNFEMKTPEGQPPDVWRRLPQEALQAALQYYKDNPQPADGHGALHSMAWAAAQHSLELDRELQATVAGLERRLQQQDGQLRDQDKRLRQQDQRLQQQEQQQQEVAALQATVAGLESRQEQDDRQRQEVADLKATVAAMGAQLQALLLQNSLQEG